MESGLGCGLAVGVVWSCLGSGLVWSALLWTRACLPGASQSGVCLSGPGLSEPYLSGPCLCGPDANPIRYHMHLGTLNLDPRAKSIWSGLGSGLRFGLVWPGLAWGLVLTGPRCSGPMRVRLDPLSSEPVCLDSACLSHICLDIICGPKAIPIRYHMHLGTLGLDPRA